jgi:hypothetical protein
VKNGNVTSTVPMVRPLSMTAAWEPYRSMRRGLAIVAAVTNPEIMTMVQIGINRDN